MSDQCLTWVLNDYLCLNCAQSTCIDLTHAPLLQNDGLLSLRLLACMGATQTKVQLTATEASLRDAKDREKRSMERESRSLQQQAELSQQLTGLRKQRDELLTQARELVEGLRTAGCATARCIAALSGVVRSLQRSQSQQVRNAHLRNI